MLICRNAKAPSKLALVKLVENSLYLTHPWTVQLNWGEDLSSFCQWSYRCIWLVVALNRMVSLKQAKIMSSDKLN